MESKEQSTKKPRKTRKPKEKKQPVKLPKRPKAHATTAAHRAGSERWNLKNKEKIKGYMKTYYQENKAQIIAHKKQYRAKKRLEKLYYGVLIQLKEKVPEKKDFRAIVI